MWPKRNYENKFGGARRGQRQSGWRGGYGAGRQVDNWSRNRRGRGTGGGYNQSGVRYNQASSKGFSQRRGGYGVQKQRSYWERPQPKKSGVRVGEKRQLNRNDANERNKRQKSNVSNVPLSTVLLARPGAKDGEVPEFIFGGFYDCEREVELGRITHSLRINVNRKMSKKRDTVSIPISLDSIAGVTVLSGMNEFEELLKAHTNRIALRASIERWGEVLEKREATHAKKLEELSLIPIIEDEPVEEVQNEVENEVVETEPEVASDVQTDEAPAEDNQEVLINDEELEEAKRLAEEKKKLESEKQAAEMMKLEAERKERELKREERRVAEAAVEKVAILVQRAKESLADEQEKLEKIQEDFGEDLALFENETDSVDAQRSFLEALQQGEKLQEQQENLEKEQEEASTVEPKEHSEGETEQVEVQGEEPQAGEAQVDEGQSVEVPDVAEKEHEDIEMTDGSTVVSECSACGAAGEADKKFCGECGAKQGESQGDGEDEVEDDFEMVTEAPAWVVLTLKKPLEKFYASLSETTICDKVLLKKTSMIVLGYNPKKTSSEHLKTLNEVFEGPWNDIRKKPKNLLSESSYSLERTLHYLVKLHKRQEVSDNTLETCQQCEKSIKRVYLEKHMKNICIMREEACPHCETVFVMKQMQDHHENGCLGFPIPCPQKCGVAKFPRSDVEEHFKVCKNTLVCCDFNSLGCNAEIKRREVVRHMNDTTVDHIHLLKKQLKLVTDYLQKRDKDLVNVFNPVLQPAEKVKEGASEGAMETDEQE